MSEISRNKMSWRIMIPVMLFAVMQAAPKAFSSVIANIAQDFPNESTTLVQMVLTLPTLMIIPISIIIGLLASYVTKKNLVIFALACELIGGIMPTFLHKTISALLVSSALIGVGEGFLISLASAVLAEYFDGNTRGKALGFKEAASSLGIAG
jgi:MFS family permease